MAYFLEEPVVPSYDHFYQEPPSYEAPLAPSSVPQTEREFSLQNDKGRPFLTLKVRSHAPATSLPTYFEGQPIQGKVVLDLEKPESIKSVTVSVRGAARFSRLDERPFVEVTETLFKSDSASPGLFSGLKAGGGVEKWPEGKKEFDFSISLPSEVQVDKGQWHDLRLDKTAVRLPPSLTSKAWSWAFFYEIVVEVKRAGLLAVDDTLKQSIGYTPIVKEPEPSQLRLQSYKDGSPLHGPEDDPTGWQVFPPVEIVGELFKSQKTKVTYTLAIAAPLAYAAVSIIPFLLTIESDDDQALALLSDPKAPDVSLRRKIKTIPGVGDVGGTLIMPGAEEERPISSVVWTTAQLGSRVEGNEVITNKVLYGEMQLPNASTLRPSFDFGDFHMKYRIEMWAPIVAGFVPENKERLWQTDVHICSVPFGGPRRAFLASGVVPTSKDQSLVSNGKVGDELPSVDE